MIRDVGPRPVREIVQRDLCGSRFIQMEMFGWKVNQGTCVDPA